ncbi:MULTISPECIES: Fe2+-dependent dioxygenase [Dyella]|uniref:Fe2+-dependent dioxygenase n=2 Tax=Dyella TaxID=231454 RepID=A0A4R0YYF6_9GAMM|nr:MULTISPECIES: Fe2+-dependent dioxygenase [Dyella]TBR40000.1 Fe2+-dependent dioxygenase [Dyella terrae]TCI12419.1 Fe2+-dependent dioxygenase [Dyella soli]
MLLHISDVLSAEQVQAFRQKLDGAEWADGRVTAGYQSAQAKDNAQLDESHPVAKELGALVTDAVLRHPTFFAGALPRHIYPPLFNRYSGGQQFGFHVDNAIRYDRSQQPAMPIRTDLSCTLFLAGPDEYDGGELIIEDSFGTHAVKLPAGDLILYPASSLHKVEPVTRGARVASFFWIQSLVRDEGQRRILFDLDVAIQGLTQTASTDPDALLQLTGVYHNLLRQWGES